MKLVALPAHLILTFFLVAALVLNFSYAVFLYLMFSFLILVIFWSCKPSKDKLGGRWPPYYFHVKMHMLRERVRMRTIRMLNRHVRLLETHVYIQGASHNNEKAQDNGAGTDNVSAAEIKS
uniref:Uncharacterized protein n=1 Tax=Salix viminalis TaxID=40686 RepID=A0A6N2KRV2_SALVM